MISARSAAVAHRFARFLVVGTIATAAHYLVLVALVELAAVEPTVASATGFAIGAILSYVINYEFTFRSSVPHRIALPRFLVVASVGVLLNSVTMALVTAAFDVHYLAAQVAATVVALLWNFAVNHFWSFGVKF
jgi:putative flippase GtrA